MTPAMQKLRDEMAEQHCLTHSSITITGQDSREIAYHSGFFVGDRFWFTLNHVKEMRA